MPTKIARADILAVAIVFIVALSVSWGNLMVTYTGGAEYSSKYEHFYVNNSVRRVFLDRSCGDAVDLKERHRLRWVSWLARTKLYDIAKDLFGYKGVGAAYAILHALFVVIAFWFTYLVSRLLLNIMDNKERVASIGVTGRAGIRWVVMLVFLVLYLFTFNGRVSEYTFSVIEAAFVAAGVFYALKRRILPFVAVVSLAVLHRESGFFLLLVWLLLNGVEWKRMGGSVLLLLPPIVFVMVNLDILHCLITQDFLISSKPQPGQLTYHMFFEDFGGVVKGMVVIAFNYAIYLIPVLLVYRELSRDIGRNYIVNRMMIMLMGYFLIFLVATPLNHMSVKYITVPILGSLISVWLVVQFSSSQKQGIQRANKE